MTDYIPLPLGATADHPEGDFVMMRAIGVSADGATMLIVDDDDGDVPRVVTGWSLTLPRRAELAPAGLEVMMTTDAPPNTWLPVFTWAPDEHRALSVLAPNGRIKPLDRGRWQAVGVGGVLRMVAR